MYRFLYVFITYFTQKFLDRYMHDVRIGDIILTVGKGQSTFMPLSKSKARRRMPRVLRNVIRT